MDSKLKHILRASRAQAREAADSLLSGDAPPQELPAGWGSVERLLGAVRAVAASPSGEAAAPGIEAGLGPRDRETIASMTTILAEAPDHKGRRFLRRPARTLAPHPLTVFGARLTPILVTAVLAFLMGLASFGRLPGPAQNAVATAFSKVGITLPRADESDQDQEGNDLPTRPVGPDLSGPARKGLCTAFSAGNGGENGGKLDSVPFRNLQNAADDANQTVEEFCADVTTPGDVKEHGHGHGQSKDHENQSDHGNGSNGHGQGNQGQNQDHGSQGQGQDKAKDQGGGSGSGG